MAYVSAEEISDEFDEFGEEVDDDQTVKLQELCKSYNIDANSIVNQWMAFSSSRKMDLSLETLEVFDREWLPKKLQGYTSKTPQSKSRKGTVFNKNTVNSVVGDDLEILATYSTPEEKNQLAVKRQRTPDDANQSKKRFASINGSSPVISNTLSPTLLSPAGATPSAKFSARTNAGEVVQKFGNHTGVSWKGEGHGCKVNNFDPDTILTSQMKYMFQKLSEKACVLNEFIEEMGTVLQNAHGIEEYSHVGLPSQDTVTVVGRVCCDSIGRLNSQSALLEGSVSSSAGKCISLDLCDLQQYSLFPGQIIACDGVNITGKAFAAKKIYQSVPLPFPQMENEQENVNKLRIVVAVGPYAPTDGLDYSPLSDLIKYIKRDKPDICIMMGPFVDSKNPLVNGGEIEVTFEELFVTQMQQIGSATKDLGCKVVIVPSSRDAHRYHSVYPQAPFSIPSHNPDGSKKLQTELELTNDLLFVSDPATLCVNGVVIGLTSTDILMHLTKSEMSVGASQGLDRMGRLAQHVLHQRSYYPLYPPAEEVNIDYEYWDTYARLPVTPHILILPSDLKSFVKDIGGCCCVNPGRVTTGLVGGTYAQLVIDTQLFNSSSSSTSSSTMPASAVVAQVIKV